MEEQNQEKETVTQHVTVTDAAAPDTGERGQREKGGGKDKKAARELTPKQDAAAEKAVGVPVDGVAVFG